jgi:hypothetical protein
MSVPGLVVRRELDVCQHCPNLSSLTVQIEMTLPDYFVLEVTQGFVERVAFSHDTFQLS